MISLLAVMAQANEWAEIADFARMKEAWLRKFLLLPHGIPSHDTNRLRGFLNFLTPGLFKTSCSPSRVKFLCVYPDEAMRPIDNFETGLYPETDPQMGTTWRK
jgi:hypothetical protein